MALYYLALDRELFWLVEPHDECNLIIIVQELIPKLTSEPDVAARASPVLPYCQKVLFVVARQTPTKKLVGPRNSGPVVSDVMESIHSHKIQCQAKPLRVIHIRE